MSSIEWETPPPVQRGAVANRGMFSSDVRDALRANPGAWAVVKRDVALGNGSHLHRRYGSEGFEFTTRRNGNPSPTRGDLYARWCPPSDDEAVS